MNREVVLSWLQDVRDLEVAKHALDNAYEEKTSTYRKLGVGTNVPKPSMDEDAKFPVAPTIFLLLGVFGLVLFVAMGQDFVLPLILGYLGVFGIWFLVSAIGMLSARFDYRANMRAYREKVGADAIRRFAELEAKPELGEEIKEIAEERVLCSTLLDEAYESNILPVQNRNLASVLYIYDYMSTSTSDLDNALLHAHMEDGVKRILAKLDEVMAQNEHIILQNRCVIENQKTLAAQNKQLYREIGKVAETASEAREYARMANLNSQIAGFFSTASYLNTCYGKRR